MVANMLFHIVSKVSTVSTLSTASQVSTLSTVSTGCGHKKISGIYCNFTVFSGYPFYLILQLSASNPKK